MAQLMTKRTKFVLDEDRIPRSWYNIVADLPVPPAPVLHPGTGQPIGPADEESKVGDARIAPISQLFRELGAGWGFAAFVESDDGGALGDCGPQQLRFAELQLFGRQAAALFHFNQLPGQAEPSGIVVEYIAKRTCAQAADRRDGKTHRIR